MKRVDLFPTHEYQGLKLRQGRPYPFGALVFGNTGMPAPDDICEPGSEPLTDNQQEVLLGPRSIIVLVGK